MSNNRRLLRTHEDEWWAFRHWTGFGPTVRQVVVLHRGRCPHGDVPLHRVTDFFWAASQPGVSVCGRCFMEVRPGTEPLARNAAPYPRWRQVGYQEDQARRWAAHRAYAARNAWREAQEP
jgi:hypothetical protein